MTRAPYVMGKANSAFDRAQKIEDTTLEWRLVNPAMRDAYGVDSMPQTGENVAAEYGVTRAKQDLFALRSQEKAVAAQTEIVRHDRPTADQSRCNTRHAMNADFWVVAPAQA